MKAYVFVTAEGEATDLAAALRAVPGVIAADATTGEYDVIAVCEAESLLELSHLVREVQRHDGVIESVLRIVIGPPARAARRAAVAA